MICYKDMSQFNDILMHVLLLLSGMCIKSIKPHTYIKYLSKTSLLQFNNVLINVPINAYQCLSA